MTRPLAAVVALVLLLGLTAATPGIGTADAWLAGGLAVVKIGLVGGVFLELDRSWPGFAVGALLLVGGVLGGAALLTHA